MSLQEACGAAYTVDKGKRFKWNAGYFGASPTWNRKLYYDKSHCDLKTKYVRCKNENYGTRGKSIKL